MYFQKLDIAVSFEAVVLQTVRGIIRKIIAREAVLIPEDNIYPHLKVDVL